MFRVYRQSLEARMDGRVSEGVIWVSCMRVTRSQVQVGLLWEEEDEEAKPPCQFFEMKKEEEEGIVRPTVGKKDGNKQYDLCPFRLMVTPTVSLTNSAPEAVAGASGLDLELRDRAYARQRYQGSRAVQTELGRTSKQLVAPCVRTYLAA